MKVYLLWASTSSYDEREEKVVGVFTTEEKAADEKYKTQDYYERIYTGIEVKNLDELEEFYK